ncbi:MAG: ABC transporter ATP-binding protein [Microthrixaceae bacterium]
MNRLALHDVSLSFADGDERVHALDHVTLSVEAGELVAISGASGSGKSSLLAVAGALRTPESGTVLIGDVDITAAAPRARAAIRRRQLGFVFQQSNLFEALTATDQLLYLASLTGMDRDAARTAAAELLAAVGMSDKADHRPGQLSGGERQRVGIARALINEPSVILADEPTSALDAARAREIVQLLRDQAHRRRIAAVMVTHDLGILAEADRVVTICDGRIVDDAAA